MRSVRLTWSASLVLAAVAIVRAQQGGVDASALLRDVEVLAADNMEGRLAGSPGGARARAYIITRLKEIGVELPSRSYEAPFTFRAGQTGPERKGTNVIGIIRGTKAPDQYIVVTAHYDHIGVRNGQTFNGADDNASGVAAILAVCQAFHQARPAHSLLIAILDAEESGLNGARALLAAPPVPRESMAMNVNLDMVGRDAANKLYASGTSHYPYLKPYMAGVARPPVQLLFGHDTPGAPGDDWTKDSDHFPFHEAGIPFVYFGVEDEEHHHKATDDADTLTKDFFTGATNTIVAALRAFDGNLENIRKQRVESR